MLLAEAGKSVRECEFALYAGNLVCNDVLLCWYVVGEEADGVIDHEATLYAAQRATDGGMLTGLPGP
jgi:hypothetical protein